MNPSLFLAATFVTPHVNYVAILPELILIAGALVLLLSGQLVFKKVPIAFYSIGSGAIATAALVASLVLWHDVQARGPFTAVADSVAVDGFAIVFLVLVSCVLLIGSAVANDFLRREEMEGPEYHVLALLAGSGAMLMAAANDLILIFVALEIMSIPLYVLAGMDLRRRESGEAAMKYFVLGAFSSAVFVYGIALVYGATGSTNLPQIASYLSTNIVTSNGVLLAGLGLLLVGFGFKVSAVPFHMWTPDVYQGAPTPVTGFMTAIAKAGGFAALLRVFFSTFGTLRTDWQPLLWVIAIVTLLLGAILGLVQRDVKRMLAYSSINHAGFILVGLAAATTVGISGSVYYVFVYAIMVMGSFAVITLVGGRGDLEHDLDNYRGLARRQPALALAFTLLLLGQTGVPFTTGFLAKFYVISAAVKAHSYALAVIAMLSAAIAAAFYLRVVFLMYGVRLPVGTGGDKGSLSLPIAGEVPDALEPSEGGPRKVSLGPVRVPAPSAAAIFVTVAVTVVFGIWPAPLVDFAKAAGFLF
ncbi:MAG: NADH-quinone oxidoreductase subunit N [Acidimicrobiales bacterium]